MQLDLDRCKSIIVNSFMTSGQTGCGIAVLVVLCVLGIFFFPAMQGPYSAVHGPVTALLAARAASGLRVAIVRAATAVASSLGFARLTLMLSAWTVVPTSVFAVGFDEGCDLILRC